MSELRKKLVSEFEDKEYAAAYLDSFLDSVIATQIKVLREQRGLSQAGLAELAGMKQERISVLEDVNYGAWSLKTLRRIARALDVALSVSFETVASRIDTVVSFSRKSLERDDRIKSLAAAEEVPSKPEEKAEPPVLRYPWAAQRHSFRRLVLNRPTARYGAWAPPISALGDQQVENLMPLLFTHCHRPYWAGQRTPEAEPEPPTRDHDPLLPSNINRLVGLPQPAQTATPPSHILEAMRPTAQVQ